MSRNVFDLLKYGGSVMIWGGISVKGGTKLKLIDGIMDSKSYQQFLIRHALPEGKRLLGRCFIFQEDNDPKHASNLCRSYFKKKENNGKHALMFFFCCNI